MRSLCKLLSLVLAAALFVNLGSIARSAYAATQGSSPDQIRVGPPVEPEMDLSQDGTAIANGGTQSFGTQLPGTDTDLVFTINNYGSGELGLTTPFTVTGTDVGEFSIQAQPDVSIVSGYGSTTFTVRFSPTSSGPKSASISITNSDGDENPYVLNLSGTGAASSIAMLQDVTPLANGDPVDFGSAGVGMDTDLGFSIFNDGPADLILTLPLTLGGADSGQFSIATQPNTDTVTDGGSVDFTLRFSPTSTGVKQASLSIASNDPDDNPFVVNITGAGTVPDISLSQGGSAIANGGAKDFGTATVGGSGASLTFTIHNSGQATLTLSPVSIGGTDASDFGLQSQPASSTVAAGATTDFGVTFNPVGAGPKTATLSIPSNDPDEDPYEITITGTGVEQEMDVSQAGTPIADGGTKDFGDSLLGSPVTLTFLIENTGTAPLTLTTPLSTLGSTDFSIQDQPDATVSPGGNTSFDVRFLPSSTGNKSASLSIANNDRNEDPYDLTFTGTGTLPEIGLKQGTTPIADGGSYSFGSGTVGAYMDLVFSIENSGAATLDVGTLDITGTHPGDFAVQASPGAQVAPGGSTSFTIRFTPGATGHRSANLSIGNNDSDENPYDVNLMGTGILPEISLKQGSTPIADGGTQDFGSQAVGTDADLEFTIENTGAEDLTLTTPLSMGGADSGEFSLQSQPDATVAAGDATRFTVRFSPTSTGNKAAEISIANNDPDENPFTLNLSGTATPELLPEMGLKQGTTPLADGGTQDFGSGSLGTDTDLVFTIENTGTADLTLTTPFSLTGDSAFSVLSQPGSATLAPGADTSFTLRFSPTSPGPKSASLAMGNNDGDENPYDLNLTGTGLAPEMAVDSGGTDIADGGYHDFGNHALGAVVDVEFAIRNSGQGELFLDAPLFLGGADASEFFMHAQPDATVAPGGFTSFTVRFISSSGGPKTASISVGNNDPDEGPYDITFSANSGDTDGVPEATEDAVPSPDGGSGDGNGDGTLDRFQSDVASVPIYNNGGYATLDTTDTTGADLRNISTQSAAAAGVPSDIHMPCGVFGFVIDGVNEGQAVLMKVFIDRDESVSGYFKENKNTGQWEDIALSVDHTTVPGKTVLTILLTEGGPFDTDGDPTTITDPGGPGAALSMVPALDEWGALIMALLLMGVGFVFLRKTAAA